MVELDDFSSGTSSRSTKLIHGGVRYLQKVQSTICQEDWFSRIINRFFSGHNATWPRAISDGERSSARTWQPASHCTSPLFPSANYATLLQVSRKIKHFEKPFLRHITFNSFFRFWQLPYYWLGIKVYDFVSGSSCLKQSYVLGKERALEAFPMLKRDKLKGAIVYYDGKEAIVMVL